LSHTSLEQYLIKKGIVDETTLDKMRVEYNLIKDEKNFADFLKENGLLTEEQATQVKEMKFIGPEKIRIRWIRPSPPPRKDARESQKSPEPMMSESLMDTQTIMLELFDKFDIVEVIGRGGMSWVYKVVDRASGETRALKILKYAEYSQDEQVRRFTRETKVIKSLEHPNIVRLRDFGDAMGIPYYTMDLIEGTSLEDFFARKLAEEKHFLEIMEKVADAIHYAHIHGVFHRDLKPANIMIDNAGEPHLVDFGIAKLIGWESSTITQTGDVLGTPAYMSPEQAMGRFTDHRSDIFSLGTILYEGITGFNPFLGDNMAVTLSNLVTRTPDNPKKLNPMISHMLESVIMKCLDKDPQVRYQSADELAEDLKKCRLGRASGMKIALLALRARLRDFKKKFRKVFAVGIFILCIAASLWLLRMAAIFLLHGYADHTMKIKKYDRALKSYTLLLKVAPERKDVFVERGLCYRYLGKSKEALKDFERVPPTDSRSYERALMQKGVLYLSSKKFDQAAASFEALQKIRPDDEKVSLLLARSFTGKGDLKQASKAIDRTLEINGENKEAKALKAFISKQQIKP
jgi:serine/threonine protein kinase